MTVVRQSNPEIVHKVWNAISTIRYNGKAADLGQICRRLFRNSKLNETDVQHWLFMLIQDELLVSENETSSDSNDKVYQLPPANHDINKDMDTLCDWYCFECHAAGDVEKCNNCYRVFHGDCSTKAKQSKSSLKCFEFESTNLVSSTAKRKSQSFMNVSNPEYDAFHVRTNSGSNRSIYDINLCSICNMMLIYDMPNENDVKYFCYILTFVLEQMFQWLPKALQQFWENSKPAWIDGDLDVQLRFNHLIFNPVTFIEMERKINEFQYKNITQFLADVLSFHHNVAIFHGVNSKFMKLSEAMLEDCFKDLNLITRCKDCFRYSNETNPEFESNWFCLPCRPAHPLVFAKQVGYDYWPAKLIRVHNNEFCEVKYFSEYHEVALIHVNSIRPITDIACKESKSKLRKQLRFAMFELEEHKKLVENPPKDLFDIVSTTDRLPFRLSAVSLSSVKERAPNLIKNKRKRVSADCNDNCDKSNSTYSSSDSISEHNVQESVSVSVNVSVGGSSNQDAVQVMELTTPNCREKVPKLMNSLPSVESCPPTGSPNIEISIDTCFTPSEVRQYVNDRLESVTESASTTSELIEFTKRLFNDAFCKMESFQQKESQETNRFNALQMSNIKKLQWCYCCQKLACYYCCWNTSYCSTVCQRKHWHDEHKNTCRRK